MSPRAFEWCAFDGGMPGAAVALHVAPARWLLLEPDAARLAELTDAEQAGRGALTDVSGRWVRVEMPGGAAPVRLADHALNAAAPLELVLRGRGVASLWAFDCPVLIVRHDDRIEVLVEASYAASFRALVAGL
jgi:sarcosine oxidase gamma subunit